MSILYPRNESLSKVVLEQDKQKRTLLYDEWLDSFYLSDDAKKRELLTEKPPLVHNHWAR